MVTTGNKVTATVIADQPLAPLSIFGFHGISSGALWRFGFDFR
jgi:hypothetical protein